VLRAIKARERAETKRVAAATAASAAKTQHRSARRSLVRILRNRQSLRQAVVVATVIGPCRALERE
jgi:hypothetical protein